MELPRLQKKIIYLDQSAISLMMKSRATGNQDRWAHLFKRLKEMVRWQRIVCPLSWEHQRESEFQHIRARGLLQTIRTLAGGIHFRSPWEIQGRQMHQALEAFTKGEEAGRLCDWHDAFTRDPHRWHDVFALDIDSESSPEFISNERKYKTAVLQDATALYSNPQYMRRSFKEHVQEEIRGAARALITTLHRNMREILEKAGDQELPTFFLLQQLPPEGQILFTILSTLRAQWGDTQCFQKLDEFLRSAQFASMPQVRIKAVLAAAVAGIPGGKGRKPKKGDVYDLEAISSYMPYCDAMLLDNEMRSLGCQSNVHLDRDYETKLFSAKTFRNMLDWLDDVEESMPSHVRQIVSDVYGGRFGNLSSTKNTNVFGAMKRANAWNLG